MQDPKILDMHDDITHVIQRHDGRWEVTCKLCSDLNPEGLDADAYDKAIDVLIEHNTAHMAQLSFQTATLMARREATDCCYCQNPGLPPMPGFGETNMRHAIHLMAGIIPDPDDPAYRNAVENASRWASTAF